MGRNGGEGHGVVGVMPLWLLSGSFGGMGALSHALAGRCCHMHTGSQAVEQIVHPT